MATSSRLMRLIALLLCLSVVAVYAQQDLPNLETATNTNDVTPTENTASATPESTGDQTTAENTAETTAESTAESTGDATTTGDSTETTSGATQAPTTATFPDATTNTAPATFRLTGLPTIAGAGVPEIGVPYTANAPFMQKSSMPEGTVFIAVGAVLAFLGACVLAWRGLVAWSINRSVKRAALASIRGEKHGAWGGSQGYSTKSAYYKEYEAGSSMSLDHLTANGKTQKPGKHDDSHRHSSAPPAGLFFSPTAQASNRASSYTVDNNRSSAFLPAGYYASPSADAPAGGRNSTVIGGSHLAPYARNSHIGGASPSPPGSPNPTLPGSRSTTNFHGDSRAGLRTASRGPPSRDGYGGGRGSHLYTHPSSSSLAVGQSQSDLPGQRAPSAIFDDMLDVHGNGPRERY
ncbi:hypothetical protein CKM354_001240300 [Cercospora kikuchii]|uniref:Csi2 protein n=1 Tax=Cercospora kikuchii TaxID=84275 RepID=A0A9P3FLX7_9PEZI|nr:uncharacterized protein CKM354_001240300 [Cercospora kikuchii]GIZ49373.1 hypothetical protein CKM354_001240300 [Cercospora kikuchii]